jgi:transcription elongation factor GreA
MKEEFEKLLAADKIKRPHVEPLLQLVQSGYCMHRSWGFGKIKSVDTVFARLTIDFPNKPGHSMDLGFAAETLKAIPNDHILARKASDIQSLRQMAALHHLDLIKLVLQSFGNRATLEQIQQVLVPDVIADDWKKWWEVAKHELKKDGHFLVPVKKSDPIVYQTKEISLQERLMGDYRAAKGLKARLAVAHELLKNLADLGDKTAAVTEAIGMLNHEIASHLRTQPALALEGMFVRDELGKATGLAPADGELNEAAIWSQAPKLGQLLEQMPAAKHKQALHSFKGASPDNWSEALLATINSVPAKLCTEFAHLLIHESKLDQLKDTIARLVSQHTASSELLLWLGKERSDAFADILGPEVFRAMLTAMERDQFNEKKSNRLRDFILDDSELIADLIESADIEVVKDLTRALQFSPSFDDMDKRSLLARIVKIFPSIQAIISGEHVKQDVTLLVSWESLERRKNEYTDLVQKKIPANSKDIAVARSYGDLRENHEYKAAKEMQKVLMRRKHELESQLERARGMDFANAKTDAVNIGTRVKVTEMGTQHVESFAILGAWDSDPERGVISYLSPVAQSLLNHNVGEEVEFEMAGAKKQFRIEAIELFKSAEPATG